MTKSKSIHKKSQLSLTRQKTFQTLDDQIKQRKLKLIADQGETEDIPVVLDSHTRALMKLKKKFLKNLPGVEINGRHLKQPSYPQLKTVSQANER